jgi:predicted dinucleotide-binding enzyme
MLRILAAFAAFALLTSPASAAEKETIAIIGTGNVGSALGPRWASHGYKVVYGSRMPDSDRVKALLKESPKASATQAAQAARGAAVVVIAVPGRLAAETVAGLGDLKGKLIIDTTNTMGFKDGKVSDPDGSETVLERIQAAAPGAQAVKAFNTVSAVVMKNPAATGGPVTLPIAGGDAAARAKVAALAQELGFAVIDLGGPEMARFAEHLGRLYVAYAAGHRPQRLEFNFRTWTQP